MVGDRRRAKAVFKTTLPARVPPALAASDRFEPALRVLDPILIMSRTAVGKRLAEIERRYQHSQRQRTGQVARPDAAKSLLVFSRNAAALGAALAALSESPDNSHLETIVQKNWREGFGPFTETMEPPAQLIDDLAFHARNGARLTSGRDNSSNFARQHSKIGDLAAKLASQIRNLPFQAEWTLIVVQQYYPIPSSTQTTSKVAELMAYLALVSRAGWQLMKFDRGPQNNNAQYRAVFELKKLFEVVTGERASHSAKSGRAYTGIASSDFGRFATAAFKLMEDSPHKRRGLLEAMSFAIWPSRAAGSRRSLDTHQRAYERRILAILEKIGVTNFSSPRS